MGISFGLCWLLRDGRALLAAARRECFRPYHNTRNEAGERIIKDSDFGAPARRALIWHKQSFILASERAPVHCRK
jgi:hypothetical protein